MITVITPWVFVAIINGYQERLILKIPVDDKTKCQQIEHELRKDKWNLYAYCIKTRD
jgi:hypothetical protein